jgi:hypothetical protein
MLAQSGLALREKPFLTVFAKNNRMPIPYSIKIVWRAKYELATLEYH